MAADATDEWAGKSQCVATWTSGGWRFITPVEGMALYDRSAGTWAVFCNNAWEVGILRGRQVVIDGNQVVGPRATAIPGPTGGSVVDTEARAAIDAMLIALREHGLIES